MADEIDRLVEKMAAVKVSTLDDNLKTEDVVGEVFAANELQTSAPMRAAAIPFTPTLSFARDAERFIDQTILRRIEAKLDHLIDRLVYVEAALQSAKK